MEMVHGQGLNNTGTRACSVTNFHVRDHSFGFSWAINLRNIRLRFLFSHSSCHSCYVFCFTTPNFIRSYFSKNGYLCFKHFTKACNTTETCPPPICDFLCIWISPTASCLTFTSSPPTHACTRYILCLHSAIRRSRISCPDCWSYRRCRRSRLCKLQVRRCAVAFDLVNINNNRIPQLQSSGMPLRHG